LRKGTQSHQEIRKMDTKPREGWKRKSFFKKIAPSLSRQNLLKKIEAHSLTRRGTPSFIRNEWL
jgi:hypothetical protein